MKWNNTNYPWHCCQFCKKHTSYGGRCVGCPESKFKYCESLEKNNCITECGKGFEAKE